MARDMCVYECMWRGVALGWLLWRGLRRVRQCVCCGAEVALLGQGDKGTADSLGYVRGSL